MSGLCDATVPGYGYCGRNIMDWSHDPWEHVECPAGTDCNYHRFEEADFYLPVDFDVPQVVVVELDGKEYALVNWLDFRGWEVREHGPQTNFRRFGYLAVSENPYYHDELSYRIEPTGQAEQRGFRTAKSALRRLVSA